MLPINKLLVNQLCCLKSNMLKLMTYKVAQTIFISIEIFHFSPIQIVDPTISLFPIKVSPPDGTGVVYDVPEEDGCWKGPEYSGYELSPALSHCSIHLTNNSLQIYKLSVKIKNTYQGEPCRFVESPCWYPYFRFL